MRWCWYATAMNAQLAELVELAEDLPEDELASLVSVVRQRRASLRLVPPEPEPVNRFSFIGIGNGTGPRDVAKNHDYYIAQAVREGYRE